MKKQVSFSQVIPPRFCEHLPISYSTERNVAYKIKLLVGQNINVDRSSQDKTGSACTRHYSNENIFLDGIKLNMHTTCSIKDLVTHLRTGAAYFMPCLDGMALNVRFRLIGGGPFQSNRHVRMSNQSHRPRMLQMAETIKGLDKNGIYIPTPTGDLFLPAAKYEHAMQHSLQTYTESFIQSHGTYDPATDKDKYDPEKKHTLFPFDIRPNEYNELFRHTQVSERIGN